MGLSFIQQNYLSDNISAQLDAFKEPKQKSQTAEINLPFGFYYSLK